VPHFENDPLYYTGTPTDIRHLAGRCRAKRVFDPGDLRPDYFTQSRHANCPFSSLLSTGRFTARGFACHHLPSTRENLPQVAVNALPILANHYDALLARAGENHLVNFMLRTLWGCKCSCTLVSNAVHLVM
jgi:hypothetical protein